MRNLRSSSRINLDLKAPVYDGDDVRIRYFGHACILIETKDIRF